MLFTCLVGTSLFGPQWTENLVVTKLPDNQQPSHQQNLQPVEKPTETTPPAQSTPTSPSKLSKTILITIFVIEFVLFLWAIYLAFQCGRSRKDLAIHLLVAFFVPLFYIIYYFLSECRMQTL
jgi:hypothetical protein